jgi:tRNA modification GTPase
MPHFDPIVAPITGNPPAAVAWVRISGEGAWRIASEVFHPWPADVEPRKAIYGRFANGDDGLALPFPAGHSYTGEECVELSMHGSEASLRSVIEACLAAGARMAEPGEFTQRAFLNGRMDLTQAEAVRELIEAQTEIQLRQATRNRDGALRREIEGIREIVRGRLAAVEASVDFSEEVGSLDRDVTGLLLEDVRSRIERLRVGATVSRIIREGYRVAIVGPPNSGKSSLLNRLLGRNRSIVTPIPGTTRDYIEERADLDGVPVVLIDTAGLRETEDVVEGLGVELSREIALSADEIWFVYDGSVGFTIEDQKELAQFNGRAELLANKCDLYEPSTLRFVSGCGYRSPNPISVKTGTNMDILIENLRSEVLRHAPAIAINERHAAILDEALATLTELEKSLQHDGPDDLLSVLLRDIATSLGRITGQTAEADMIERIFHDFCVGK